MEALHRWTTTLRIVLAIAAKDILDAFRNKTSLSVILGVVMLVISSQALPLLLGLSKTSRVVVYDMGDSRLVADLEDDERIRTVQVETFEELKEWLGERMGVELGLVIPADFDQALGKGVDVELQGYFAYWVRPKQVEQTLTFFEEWLAETTGRPVRIQVDEERVYPHPDSLGMAFMASMSMVIAIVITGLVLVPQMMIAEREAQTLEALLVSPASPPMVMAGKALTSLVYCLVMAGLVFGLTFSVVVYWGLVSLAVLCAALFAVSLGLLVGCYARSTQAVSLWVGGLMVLLLVPIYFVPPLNAMLPGVLKGVFYWLPSAALARVFRFAYSGTLPPGGVISNLGVVLSCTLGVLVVVTRCARRS